MMDAEGLRDGKVDMIKQVYRNEDAASNLVLPMTKITEYFSDWINTIEISTEVSVMDDFAKLMNVDEDLFLTFNYTETLGCVYGAKMYVISMVCRVKKYCLGMVMIMIIQKNI